MPLPQEVLEEIRSRLERAQELVDSLEDVVSDMRVSGIEPVSQEAELRAAREDLRKLRAFYDRQIARVSTTER